jgi:hypothetical protein
MFNFRPLTQSFRLPNEIRFQLYYVENAGCWEWLGCKDKNGYGVFAIRYGEKGHRHRKMVFAHRYQYERLYGPIPAGLESDHNCKNVACINPSHLEPVTHRVNLLRGDSPAAKQARQTHCIHGHAFSGYNLWLDKRGRRHCRKCHMLRERKYKSEKRRMESVN